LGISELLSSALVVFSSPFGLSQANLPGGAEITVGAPAQKGWVFYTVQPGDTIGQIAQRYGVDYRGILWSNGLNSNTIRVGQTLRIPLVGDLETEARMPPGVRAYTVRPGDSVQSVASHFDLTVLGLVSANPGILSLDRLVVGSTLYIPTGDPGLIVRLAKGETLADLASRFGLSVMALAKANGLTSPTDLKTGDLVLLPGIQAKTTYNKLVALQEAERKARAQEEKRLADERKKREEANRKAEEQRRLEQARRQATQQAQSQSQVRRANYVVAAAGYRYPVSNFVITTYFGGRGAYQRVHTGLDMAAPYGTPIYASRAGIVETAGWSSFGYGINVILDHGDSVETLYGHMSRLAVRSGQWVERGQLIGYVGSTGWSTGPHVHFEVRVAGTARNPLAYLP